MADNPSPGIRLECQSIDELNTIVEEIVKYAGDLKVWLFEGEMGAGKTTMIAEIGQHFKVMDNVNSPTFSIVNEYRNPLDEIFYHFDFYRIEDVNEALNIGVEEYFYSGHHCFIEWPSKIESLLPDTVLTIRITVDEQEKRWIELIKDE